MHFIVGVDKARALKAYSGFIRKVKALHERVSAVAEKVDEINSRICANYRAKERHEAEIGGYFYLGIGFWPSPCKLMTLEELHNTKEKLAAIKAASGDIEMDVRAVAELESIESGNRLAKVIKHVEACEETAGKEMPPIWSPPPPPPKPEPKPRPSVWRALFYGE